MKIETMPFFLDRKFKLSTLFGFISILLIGFSPSNEADAHNIGFIKQALGQMDQLLQIQPESAEEAAKLNSKIVGFIASSIHFNQKDEVTLALAIRALAKRNLNSALMLLDVEDEDESNAIRALLAALFRGVKAHQSDLDEVSAEIDRILNSQVGTDAPSNSSVSFYRIFRDFGKARRIYSTFKTEIRRALNELELGSDESDDEDYSFDSHVVDELTLHDLEEDVQIDASPTSSVSSDDEGAVAPLGLQAPDTERKAGESGTGVNQAGSLESHELK